MLQISGNWVLSPKQDTYTTPLKAKGPLERRGQKKVELKAIDKRYKMQSSKHDMLNAMQQL